METVNIESPDIRGRLSHAGTVIRLSTSFQGLLWWCVMCFSGALALFLVDNLLRLPAGLRLPLAVAAAGLGLWGLGRRVLRPLLARRSVERTARTLERGYGVDDNLLINACQFETAPLSADEAPFAQRTIRESVSTVARIPASDLWRPDRLRTWGAGAAVLAVLWLAYGTGLPRYAGNAFARYAFPLADIPPAGALELKITPAADIVVGEGDDLEVRAEVGPPGSVGSSADNAPVIVRADGVRFVEPVRTSGAAVPMAPDVRVAGAFTYTFRLVRRPFAFRVFAGDSYSRSVRVDVRPVPKIKASLFRVEPPSYTGLKPTESPGPPMPLSGLAGSRVQVEIETDRPVKGVTWKEAATETSFASSRGRWTARTALASGGGYRVDATDPLTRRKTLLAQGEISLEADPPPEVDFLTEDRNRFIHPGASVPLDVQAADNFGIRAIRVAVRPAEAQGDERTLKSWNFLGPPGRSGLVRESFTLVADPEIFVPGSAYMVEAVAYDFQPGGLPGKSRPLVLRIKSWAELGVPETDALAGAVQLLRKTIVAQKNANALTDNLNAHLAEAVQAKTLPDHRKAMTERQTEARGSGASALAEFRKNAAGAIYAGVLTPLVDGEMPWVLGDIAKIGTNQTERLPEVVGNIGTRQQYILAQLISLLGRLSDERKGPVAKAPAAGVPEPPVPTADEAGRELKDDLEKFTHEQKRIIEASRPLTDRRPEDLAGAEEKILGELAREEAGWAKFFEEKLTDFSKLPLQDFADGSIAQEFNEVYQEIKLAAKSLYEKKVELAVPQEQSGLEKAEELVHNLEKWLPDTPDREKWLMEEPPGPSDIPLAELPAELEDIVGDLIDKEDEMAEDVEDVTSSWLDSLDKGAGWDAMDGPISDMSAKGVTGNRLPNEEEIGGRAGDGRTGRSHGQMVEATAEGKGGRETPTRLTPSPFEPGSVEDSSKKSGGGATGGGKLSGFAQEGLRGPAPPVQLDKMARLAGEQAKIRQEAEALALKLRAYHLPTGDLEGSVGLMKRFESAAARGDGLGVRRSYSRIMDELEGARAAIRAEVGLHREYSRLPERLREEIMTGLHDATPAGYEEMIAEYFRVLAERGRKP
jgi:hypothetical protein